MPLAEALEVLRAMQDTSTLANENDAPKGGILKTRASASNAVPATRSRTPFKLTDEHVHHAVKSIVLTLGGADIEYSVVLDCLKASVGVNEHSTSVSLQVLRD